MEQKKEGDEEGVVPAVNNKKDKKVQEIVFTIENSKAKKVNVETGISDDNYIQIKSGLSGKEDVVSGSYRAISRELNEGVTVRVENKEKNAPGNKVNN